MIAAHQTMLAPQGAPLPYDAEVEYIGVESLPATQYILIDEPYNTSNDYSIEFSILQSKNGDRGGIVFGWLNENSSLTTSGVNMFPNLCYNYYSKQLRSCNNGSERGYPYKTSSYRFLVEFSGINVKIYEGGVLQYDRDTGSSRASFSCNYTPLFGFMRIDNGDITKVGYIGSPGGFRLHHFVISRNGVTLRDVNPVRVGTTGYLFDRVSGQLFGNAGTGAFTIGPDK